LSHILNLHVLTFRAATQHHLGRLIKKYAVLVRLDRVIALHFGNGFLGY
jgi:hypothetical protein